jgi:hypothetical protein
MHESCMKRTDDFAETCTHALQQPVFEHIGAVLAEQGFDSASCHRLVESIDELPASHQVVFGLKSSIERLSPELVANCQVERYLLLNSALRIVSSIAELPVADSVKELYREEFAFFTDPDANRLAMFQVGQYRFAEMCKIASLRRFPAGQVHWELSGIPRSSLLHVDPLEVPRVLNFIARKLKGFRPCFNAHVNGRRKNSLMLLESAQNAAYYRIAKSMELQPSVLGYISTSWFYSPTASKVSPHLKWLSSVFLENGGMIVDLGADTPDSGALVGSRDRKALWDKGEFQPRKAMAIWPRQEMLRWAAQHPELEQPDSFQWASA